MEYKDFKEIYLSLAKINGINDFEEKAIYSLYKLENCLAEANKIHNLTAIKDTKGVVLKHFVDSLMLEGKLLSDRRLIDVGCGAGFPSLPIAICREDLTVFGVDSTSKKVNYVNETARELALQNIEAISCRAEELAFDVEYREQFDYATARAVAALPVLCELCLPFVRVGGEFIAMKAQSAKEELEASRTAIEKCGGEISEFIELELKNDEIGSENEKRSLIVIKKIVSTPKAYPRMYSKIIKKPL